MPFDPKLIQPDDAPLRADGELDLPDDLAALGEQLRDDALHLAASFPAGRELNGRRPEPVLPARSRVHPWGAVAVLAAATLATLLAGVFAVQRLGAPQDERPTLPHIAQAPAQGEAVLPATTAAQVSNPASVIPAASGPATPLSLTELSGPEMEALLDLWQREPAQLEGTGIAF